MTRTSWIGGIAAVNAATLVVVLGACGDERPAQAGATQGIVLASATPPREPVTQPTAVDTAPPPQPDYANVTYAEGESAFRRGSYRESMEMFGAYVVRNPANEFGHYLLGLSAWKTGDHQRAEEALVRAVELNGESVKIRTNLSRVLLERGRAADALPHVEKAVELEPTSHEVWRVLGNAYGQLGRSEDAIDAYRQALMLNQQDAWTMNNYGLVLIRLGRFDEAVLPLARAVELVPGSPLFQNNLGIALERVGELGGARTAFAAAVAADSGYTKAQVNLERVQSRIGDATVEPADLSIFAREFVALMQDWIAEEEHDC